MRKSAQWIIGLLISVLALGWALRDVHPAEMMEALGSANYLYVPPALVLIFVGQLARARSWQTILGHDLPFGRVFGSLNAGYLLNNVLPFRLGEVGRAYLISRTQKLTTAQALSSVLVERVIDLCMIVSLLAAFVPLIVGLLKSSAAVALAFVIPVIALSTLFIVSRRPAWLLSLVHWGIGLLTRLWGGAHRLEAIFHSFVDGLAVLHDGGRFLRAAFWSSLAWVCAGFSAWLLLLAFVPSATVPMGFFLLVVTGLGIALPSAPGNVGVWQAAAVAALGVFRITGALAFSIAVVHHFVNYGLSSAMGAIALAREGESLAHLAQSARLLLSEKEPSDRA